MNYLPIKLNKLRKHYSYSQSYIAKKLNVDVVEYMNYENGNSMINYAQMKKLCSIYHIPMKQMFLNSDDVDLYEVNGVNTDEINAKYFMPEKNFTSKIKGFVINHKLVSGVIAGLVIAIIVLSIVLNNAVRPYEIHLENINRLSVSETTVVYIDDSGAIGFTGSNSNGQLNGLTVSNAVKVVEGEGFTVVLNKDGTLVSSGLISKLEKRVNDLKDIIDIAAGSNHILALDANGKVNCIGEGKACDIDGTRDIVKIFATDNASIVLNEVGGLDYSGTLIGSSYLKDFYNVKDIASSDNILAILNNDNTLNVYSKSGTYIKSETWKDIVDVACGDDFVAGLDSYGKVYIEIDNDEIIDEVNDWSNIIAIDAGKDYLIGFDGKNIYGVGNNAYQQFVKEAKQKITLEKVSNIEYTLDDQTINIQFNGVKNAGGYLVSLNVGTGLSQRVETEEVVSFITENMIEGKTYTISIVSVGSGDYKDSDEATLTFVYEKPNIVIDVRVAKYIGEARSDLENYLQQLDVTYRSIEEASIISQDDTERVLSIKGIQDGEYSKDSLQTLIVEYTYSKVAGND